MKALVWHGRYDMRCDTVPDPVIEQDRDAIIKVTSTAICGSDLHLYDAYIPTMEKGDIVGHEFMGEVMEVGKGNTKLKVGDRVVVPFTIACGECNRCKRGLTSVCERSNRTPELEKKAYGHQTSGLFGYSHMLGGFPGGQAEYVRVPYADFTPFKVPDGLTDEQVLFLTDIFPTGYMGAENAEIEPGDTVAVWGAGPVGQFVIKSCYMFGAEQVIVIDTVPERLAMAKKNNPDCVTIDFMNEDVNERLNELTKGFGPDRCIDAVGLEAHGHGEFDAVMDRAKAAVGAATDRIHVLRQAIFNCRPGGTVSSPGVYGGFVDKFPMGAIVQKGLTLKSGQTHVNRYLPNLCDRIQKGEIDPSFIITHRVSLEDGPKLYETFKKKEDGCIKVVMHPHSHSHDHGVPVDHTH